MINTDKEELEWSIKYRTKFRKAFDAVDRGDLSKRNFLMYLGDLVGYMRLEYSKEQVLNKKD